MRKVKKNRLSILVKYFMKRLTLKKLSDAYSAEIK